MRLGSVLIPIGRPRAARHPISRWYLSPAAERVVQWLAPSWVRPVHLTVGGLLAALAAALVLSLWPAGAPVAAVFVLMAWFLDRCDGLLARRQRTDSAWGAWLDANVDELIDVGLQVAVAVAAVRLGSGQWPWFLLIAFIAGKYLFFRSLEMPPAAFDSPCADAAAQRASDENLLRRCYHLPGNTDIRVHLLVLALLTGYLTTELAVVAVYYNLRWMVRYVLVARRLGGSP